MHRYDTKRRALAFGIAGLAGFVDATGFLAASHYFVSFMSGNTTRLGVDLATRTDEAIIPLLLISGFVFGVVIGALAAERYVARRKTAVIALSTGMLAIATLLRVLGSEFGFLACSVVAMGAINNAFRRDNEVAVGLTYMTGALVRFGQGLASHIMGRRSAGWLLNLVLWASLASGAVCGAAVASNVPELSAWCAFGFAGILLFATWRIESETARPQ